MERSFTYSHVHYALPGPKQQNLSLRIVRFNGRATKIICEMKTSES